MRHTLARVHALHARSVQFEGGPTSLFGTTRSLCFLEMPPTKRRTAHAMAGGSSNTLVGSSPTAADVLVAKCSRAELEQLILTSIRSQEAVALGDVEAAIEAAAAARLQPKAPVCRDDVSMQGAGLLDVRRSDETD